MKIDINKLREAAEKATPGPWECGDNKNSGVYKNKIEFHDDDGAGIIYSQIIAAIHPDKEWDRLFIALANPATILALLKEREILREALGRVIAARHVNPNKEIGDLLLFQDAVSIEALAAADKIINGDGE